MELSPDRMTCAATLGNLNVLTAFVGECAGRCGLAPKRTSGLLVAVEEAFVNICHYAYTGGKGSVEISCTTSGDAFLLAIADSGSPFNVLSLPEPDTTLDATDRAVGGLGIHLIRTLCDSVSYRRENNRNILQMTFLRV
jgi:serine/threonine-protein kinase RsbW